MFFCLTHHQNDSRTVIYWTSAMTGLSATWRHTRGLKSGGLSPLIGKFKLPQKAWGMNKLSSNLQKKIGMFCWNFAMIGMIGMVFGYLQKNVKLSLSLSFITQKKLKFMCFKTFLRNLPCLWWVCWTRNFAQKYPVERCAASLGEIKRRRSWGFVRTFNTPKSWSCSQCV